MTEGRRLVLVVDDDGAVRDSLKFALELEGFAVHVFASGSDLLADPHLDEAGCIVLDHDMPAMGGFAVLGRLRALNHHVPIVLLTDYASHALRRRARAAGVRHVVEKPLLNGMLVESIRDVLDPVSP